MPEPTRQLALIMLVLRSENVGGLVHRNFCVGGFTDIADYQGFISENEPQELQLLRKNRNLYSPVIR